ncbi:unnamed protein product [Dovyalis caffra]|uniref:R13L1/DRL21-like LRR repeat region domain-containing protein n=1 Tax=Dovyalis caffra TaxID=77055 RepID=A0AAV1SMQ3_9ROSI|nr:unnamed protein product [Dovyalis caffra]
MRGLEGLSSLRELDAFYVSGSEDGGEVSNLEDLKNLNHIQRSLEIGWLRNVTDPEDGKKAELKSKEHLVDLTLEFSRTTSSNRITIRDDEVLEALEPPPILETLRIEHYQGIREFPSCIMSLTKLKVVTLWSCHKIENLPPFGKLPSLEFLNVFFMDEVIKVGHELLGLQIDDRDNAKTRKESKGEMVSPSNIIAFPKLKRLYFGGMENWEEWDDGSWTRGNEDKTNMSIMPCLRSLGIFDCPKLKALPDYLYQSTTLEELQINSSPILAKHFQERTGKGWPNISHTPNIRIIN